MKSAVQILSEILGYPMSVPVIPTKATIKHRCGIYKEGYNYVAPKEPRKPKHSTSTVDHTGMTATQRQILAVLQKSKKKLDASEVARAIKMTHGTAGMNMTKMWQMNKIERELVKNGQTRWYIYYVS